MAQNLDTSRVVARFNQRMRSSVVATVHDFQLHTPRLARVIVCFNTNDSDAATKYAAIAHALDGKAVPVDDSFRPIHSHALPTMVGFVRSNTEVLDFEEGTKRGMRAMAANILMDPSDESTWEVRHAAGAKVLVRQGTEDLSSVMTTARVKLQRTPMLAALASEVPEARRFVAFVDPRFNTTRYGYVLQQADLNTVEILPFPAADETGDAMLAPQATNDSEEMRGDGNVVSQRMAERMAPISVGMDNLVETAHMNGTDSFAAIAAPSGSEKDRMIDYYRKVYDYSPSYFQKVVEVIQGHAGV